MTEIEKLIARAELNANPLFWEYATALRAMQAEWDATLKREHDANVASMRHKHRGDNHWETLRSIRDIATSTGDIARIVQWVNDAGSGYTETAETTLAAEMDRRLAAEAKLAEVEKERDDFRSCLATTSGKLMAAEATVASLTAQVEAMRGALTPSADTKADYIGEFSFPYCTGFDDYGHDIITQISVPWSTIKEIMAAIRARAALTTEKTNG